MIQFVFKCNGNLLLIIGNTDFSIFYTRIFLNFNNSENAGLNLHYVTSKSSEKLIK